MPSRSQRLWRWLTTYKTQVNVDFNPLTGNLKLPRNLQLGSELSIVYITPGEVIPLCTVTQERFWFRCLKLLNRKGKQNVSKES